MVPTASRDGLEKRKSLASPPNRKTVPRSSRPYPSDHTRWAIRDPSPTHYSNLVYIWVSGFKR